MMYLPRDLSEAKDIQEKLKKQVIIDREPPRPSLVGGVDAAYSRKDDTIHGCVTVLEFPSLELVAHSTAEKIIEFPYISGYLSFRELPVIMEVLKHLDPMPELLLVDGQGIAHPRRLGIASHLGVLTGISTIGCAKSLLIGNCTEPAAGKGCFSEIRDGEKIIGAALRTRANVKPMYISVGHKISLQRAIKYVLDCCPHYRIPEPIRLAHNMARKIREEHK